MHLRTVDSEMVAEGGGGSGGVDAGGPWGCLDSISLRIVSDGLARPVEVRAWIDLLYRPSWAIDLARLALCSCPVVLVLLEGRDTDRLVRDFPMDIASCHRSRVSWSPSNQRVIRDLTSFKMSLQRRRWPEEGLARTHLASKNMVVQ